VEIPMRYYKWMADGKPIYGRGTYAPPGEWQPRIESKLEMCWRGYHVCTADQIPYWCGTELIEVEVRDEDIVDSREDKILCRTWREIRRFRWTCKDMVEYVRACALAVPVIASDTVADAARYVADNYTRYPDYAAMAAASVAAYAAYVASLSPKAWIEDRIREKLT
jgi:hypothetical protein